jgi:hypothetical protein
VSVFITEDDEIIVFDDIKKTLVSNLGKENFSNHKSPLEISILHFLTNQTFSYNKQITLKITKNLEDAIQ